MSWNDMAGHSRAPLSPTEATVQMEYSGLGRDVEYFPTPAHLSDSLAQAVINLTGSPLGSA